MIELFYLIGIILMLGYLADWLFERTGISYVLLLMGFGFVIGPLTGVVDYGASGFPQDTTAFVGTLALIVILFDSGLNIDIFRLLKVFTKSISYTFAVFILSSAATAIIMWQLFGWTIMQGLLLGFIVGGNSSVVVTTMTTRSKAREGTTTFLTLESTLTDVLCIISAYALIEIIQSGDFAFGDAPSVLASAFSTAIVLGVVAGIFWLTTLRKLGHRNHSYMITLATAFLVYALSESFGGNGGIAVLFYALTLSNGPMIAQRFDMMQNFNPASKIKQFQHEISFFVRSFFFVFLGLILMLEHLLSISIVIAAILCCSYVILRRLMLVIAPSTAQEHDSQLTYTMIPRGLAAAVLATLPATSGLFIDSFEASFEAIVFGVIILSNAMATIGVFISTRTKQQEDSPDEVEKRIKNKRKKR